MDDLFGLELSTRSLDAAREFNLGLERLLYQQDGAVAFFEGALAHDPEFGFASAAGGIALRLEGQMARGAVALSKAAASALNDRESSLLQAILAMAAVRFDEADALIESHLTRWPRDALALMLHGSILNIFSSRPDRDVQLLRTVEACLPAFEGHPYVLGQFALALEENRTFTEAHTVAVEAVREVPNNARAAHAAAHTYFETGQLDECEEFVESWIRQWENAGPFTCHLVWHRALSALTRGDTANAKRGLADILAYKGKSLAVLSDAASLAWRLRLDGEDVGGVWDELEPLPDVVGNRFGNAHRVMVLAARSDFDSLEPYAEKLFRAGGANRETARWARAVKSFTSGDVAESARLLDELEPTFRVLGGSQAQTDVFRETHITALERCGRRSDARRQIERRLRQRPAHRDELWLDRLR